MSLTQSPIHSALQGGSLANEPRLATESIAGQRPYQEDAVLAETLADGRVLLAVADGMGGHAAGEVASALALEGLQEALAAGRSLTDAFTLANTRVYEQAKEPGKQGMGTTLVAALVNNGQVEWANVGDSRGYVITGNEIEQLTEDHSFVAEAVKRGQSEAEAMAGPWKDALTRSIGTEEEVEVDVFGPLPVRDNSALIVCSDGLYKTLSNADLLTVFSQSEGPSGAAHALVSSAFANGSDDNITVAVAEYGEVMRLEPGGTVPLNYTPPRERAPETDTVVRSETEVTVSKKGPSVSVQDAPGNRERDPRGAAPVRPADPVEVAGPTGGRSLALPAIIGTVVVVGALLAFFVFG